MVKTAVPEILMPYVGHQVVTSFERDLLIVKRATYGLFLDYLTDMTPVNLGKLGVKEYPTVNVVLAGNDENLYWNAWDLVFADAHASDAGILFPPHCDHGVIVKLFTEGNYSKLLRLIRDEDHLKAILGDNYIKFDYYGNASFFFDWR